MAVNFQRHNKLVYIYELAQDEDKFGSPVYKYVPSKPETIRASAMTSSMVVQGDSYPITMSKITLRTRYSKHLKANCFIKFSGDTVLYKIVTIMDPDLSKTELVIVCDSTPLPLTPASGG